MHLDVMVDDLAVAADSCSHWTRPGCPATTCTPIRPGQDAGGPSSRRTGRRS